MEYLYSMKVENIEYQLMKGLYPTGRAFAYGRNFNLAGDNEVLTFFGSGTPAIEPYSLILANFTLTVIKTYSFDVLTPTTFGVVLDSMASDINDEGFFTAHVYGTTLAIKDGTAIISPPSSGASGEGLTKGSSFVGGSGSVMRARLQSFIDANIDAEGILDQILPDNDGFDLADIENWERVYDIDNSSLTEAERKQIILARKSFPNGEVYRQTAEFLQLQLQAHGFDLYVHENRFDTAGVFGPIKPIGTIYGTFKYGELVYGIDGIAYDTILSNYIDKDIDEANTPSFYERENNIFFIGGETFQEIAYVDPNRIEELKHLVLSLKPAQSSAALLIDSEPINYGYLYNAFAFLAAEFAPAGWRLASRGDYQILHQTIGETTQSGKWLKEKGKSHWNNANGSDLYGFSSRGGGLRLSSGAFSSIGAVNYLAANDLNPYAYVTYDTSAALNSFSEPYEQGMTARLIKEDSVDPGSYEDLDGNKYSTVKIGSQVWMKQNWACTKYNDGSPITKITDNAAWAADTLGAYCSYDNDDNNAIRQ